MKWYATHLVVLLLAMATIAPAAGTQLKIATLAPEGSYWMEAMRRGAEDIERRTEGRVGFRFYPGGTMGNDQAVLRKMRIGQLHGGAMLSGTLAELDPTFELYGLPLLFQSYSEVDAVRKETDSRLIARLADQGLVGFGFIEGGFAYLMSVQPTRSLADLKGRKAWMPEGDVVGKAILEAAGLSPVPLPLSDVLTGLQTGLVDTVAGPPVGAVALQWFTKTRYMTPVPIVYTYGALVLSSKAFDKLAPADRDIVRDVLAGVTRDLDVRAREDNKGAREALVAQGVQVVEASPEFEREWQRVAATANAKLADVLPIDATLRAAVATHLAAIRSGTGS